MTKDKDKSIYFSYLLEFDLFKVDINGHNWMKLPKNNFGSGDFNAVCTHTHTYAHFGDYEQVLFQKDRSLY